ncbi:hypothetical protein P4V41_07185 [Fictibacillus nanhaiensis]|uniref:hypothetical protein n=1 Tax=Fictibacillus nanhaiensis TaxID=742169 RepID=UPI002E23232A|nr:hypothetical protein [Fictibacillus nanhaiensis]
MSEIKIARYRTSPYIVNFITNGGTKVYSWSGSKGKKVDIKPIPQEVVEWLTMNSVCFRDGELAIIEENKEAKEIVENIDDLEEYRNNTHSTEEAIKILEGNVNKMKAELKKITNKDEKKFFIDTAKEIKLDSNAKLTFLADWFGIKKDILFDEV